jgi:hypothetical protein
MKHFFVFALMILPVFRLMAQEEKPFPVDQLKQDYAVFKTALTEAHPGLYRYTSKGHFEKEFRVIEKELNRPMTEAEFYRLLAPIVANIKCGHTKFQREERNGNSHIFYPDELFPLKLYFIDRRAFVFDSYDDSTGVPAGSEILSINGKTISSILEKLLPNIFADGNGESLKYQQLNSYFFGYYSTFVGPAKQFSVRYKHERIEKTEELPCTTLDRIVNKEKNRTSNLNGFEMSYPTANTAVMRIPVFMPQQSGPSFEEFLESSFAEIRKKNIQHLIIDLRDNEGGMDSWGKKLYSYLTDQPFYYYDRLSVATDKDFSFREYATLPEQFDQLRGFVKKQGNDYVFTQHENLGIQQPQANPYMGSVYILQNGRSFSVTAEFAAIVRDNKRGIFIGEESGGALSGNNSGAFAIVKLPNTHLTLGIPLLGYYMHLETKKSLDRGILPDHYVQPTINDLLENKDPVKDAALRLITTQKRQS